MSGRRLTYRTKVRHPQTNGATEKLNQTIKNEFYSEPVLEKEGLVKEPTSCELIVEATQEISTILH